MANMMLRLKDEVGVVYKWRVRRDARRPAAWMLEDHTGYQRTLEANWFDCVPRIRLIADNHGLSLLSALS
jgi:hypothetical protein